MAEPRLELPEGARGLLPPWYATVPGLRKGKASRCNIKRASPHGCPPQPLRGQAKLVGGGARPPLVRHCFPKWHFYIFCFLFKFFQSLLLRNLLFFFTHFFILSPLTPPKPLICSDMSYHILIYTNILLHFCKSTVMGIQLIHVQYMAELHYDSKNYIIVIKKYFYKSFFYKKVMHLYNWIKII